MLANDGVTTNDPLVANRDNEQRSSQVLSGSASAANALRNDPQINLLMWTLNGL